MTLLSLLYSTRIFECLKGSELSAESKSNITSYSYIANYIDFAEPNDCKYGGKVGINLLGKYSGKSNSIFIGRIIHITEVCYFLIAAVCSFAKYSAGLGCGISFTFQILIKKVFTILSSIASLDLSVILASNFERSSFKSSLLGLSPVT